MNITHIRKLVCDKLSMVDTRVYYNNLPLVLETGYLPAPFGRAENGLVQLELVDCTIWRKLTTFFTDSITFIRTDGQSNKDYIHIHVFNCPIFNADGQLLTDVDLTTPFKANYLLDLSTIGYHHDKPYLSIKVLQVRLLEINDLPPGMVIYHDIESYRTAVQVGHLDESQEAEREAMADKELSHQIDPKSWSDVNELMLS